MSCRRWCPNCVSHYQRHGSIVCEQYDSRTGFQDDQVLGWLQANSHPSGGGLSPEADGCPRFIPHPELAMKLWASENDVVITDGMRWSMANASRG